MIRSFLRAIPFAGCLLIAACAGGASLTPAQIQQDLDIAQSAFKTAGCATAALGGAAAPIVAVTVDDKGNKVLQAATASGVVLCTAPAPATIVSAPGTTLTPVVAPAPAPVAPAPAPTSMNEGWGGIVGKYDI